MFKDNKYTKQYYRIIDAARGRTLLEYVERHHIIPRCLGGSNALDNIVSLTPREHFICHLLLTKMHGHKRLALALTQMMSGKRYLPSSSKIYDLARKKASEAMSGSGNPMFGVSIPCPEEKRLKIQKSMLKSEAIKRRSENGTWKKRVSEVQRAKMPGVVLNAVDDGREVARFANVYEASEALGCSTDNLAHAFKDRRPIGKRLKTLPTRCWVTLVPKAFS